MRTKNFLFVLLLLLIFYNFLKADFGIGLPSVIEKRAENVKQKVSLIKKPEVLVKIEITPTTAQVKIGEQIQFTAKGKDNKNKMVEIQPTWSVVGNVGSITNTGLFTATKTGTGKIKAEVEEIYAEVPIVVVSTSGVINTPPNTPIIISGSTSTIVGTTEYFLIYADDFDNDDVFLTVDWGDGNISTSSYFSSGSSITIPHVWSVYGTYKIKTLATDINNETSQWSEYFTIIVSSISEEGQPPQIIKFKLNVSVQPIGAGYVEISPLETEYVYGTTITLTAVANQGYEFSNWAGNVIGNQNVLTFVITEDINAIANFTKTGDTGVTYTLTTYVEPEGAGSVVLSPAGGVYPIGTVVTVYAQANPGCTFDGWSGNLSGTQNPAQITMNANKIIRANFSATQYTLTINISPQGAGTVSLSPSGGTYIAGTTVTAIAQPNSGYTFNGWSGDITSTNSIVQILMNNNKSITANFTGSGGGITYTLTVNINPSGAGTVSLDPIGGVYAENTQVTITATPSSGYEFAGWSGDITSYSNPYVLVMDSNKTVTANFTQKTYAISTSVYPPNSGTISLSPSGGSYTVGTEVQLTATPSSNYTFFMWLDTDIYSRSNPLNIVVTENKTFRACFMLTTTGSSFNVYSDQGAAGFVGGYYGQAILNLLEDSTIYKEGTKSMKMTVLGTSEESYGGWYVEEGAGGGSEVKNMSAYQYGYLRFWVKGQLSSGVIVGIFSDNLVSDTAKSKVDISNYGYIGNDNWQDIAIPLQDFKQKEPNLDFTQIETYFSIAIVGQTNGEKNLWVDNVRWTTGEQDTHPSILVSNLTNGTTVSGLITITASASDDVGVTKVEFYIDNQLKQTDTQSPYIYLWYTTSTTNGAHLVKVVAYDTLSQTATAQITIYVNNVENDQPPTITITSPTNNSTVSGTINVVVSINDDKGIQRVEYYIDNSLQYTSYTSPYSWVWYTTNTVSGIHTLKAVAYDTVNQTAYHQISLTVSNITYTLNIYNDSGISGNDVWTWSDGGQGIFANTLVSDAPEGSYAFVTNTNAGTWAGWGVVYTPTKVNLSQYSGGWLKFWIKTPVNLKVEIRDTQLRGPLYINQYGWNGTNTWQEITIPLSNFGNVDFSQIELPFMITCETQTTFYVDDVKWIK